MLFVNVPIGLAVAIAAPRVLGESSRRRGKFDLPGAITGTLGLAALVYGLSNAATSQNGQSHWGDTKVVVSLVAAVVLLAAFVFTESRSPHALVPFRVLRNRNRSGAYIIMLCLGTAMFGMFFFLTLFLQEVWGYNALGSGIAYLPFVSMILVASAVASQLVPRIGARPLLLIGSVLGSGGLVWLSQVNEHSSYASGLLGPMLLTAFGFGLIFVPLSLMTPGWPPACSTPASRSAARSAWPSWARWRGAHSPKTSARPRPRPRRPRSPRPRTGIR